MVETSITNAFEHLTDPRKKHPPRHSLINIITISICAVICGAENFVDIEEFGKSKENWFKTFLDLPYGIPSHDTFLDVLNRLNREEFARCFTHWINGLATNRDDIIAIDGKVMRGTRDKINNGQAIWLVNAWSVENNVCFGHVQVDDKSNEITAIPELLSLLELRDSTVTLDAMGCQTAITEQVIDKGAHFVISLKGNQGTLHEDVSLFLDTLTETPASQVVHDKYTDVDAGHGRIETRSTWFTTDVDWLIERHPGWSSIKGIAVVEAKREIGEECSVERRYFITSHDNKSAQDIGYMVHAHWGVENKLHWQLDMSFSEDSCRLRSGHAAANFSLLNKIALALLKNEKTSKTGVKNKRLKSGWDETYMMKVLTVGLG